MNVYLHFLKHEYFDKRNGVDPMFKSEPAEMPLQVLQSHNHFKDLDTSFFKFNPTKKSLKRAA